MIPRRAAGALILVVGLTAALVLPAALGRRIAGTAGRPPIPDPPVVGDCLTEPPEWATSPLVLPVVLATAPVAACSDAGSSFGEVVSVTGASTRAVVLGAFEWDDCAAPLQAYLGWPSSRWRPAQSAVLTLLGPDAAQVVVGQAWVACALITGPDGIPARCATGSGRPPTGTATATPRARSTGRPGRATSHTTRRRSAGRWSGSTTWPVWTSRAPTWSGSGRD